jgi:hypothetical protein
VAAADGEPEFTDDEILEIWRIFEASRCDHCGGGHARACPKVRRFEFHQNGNLAVVEFWPAGKWPDDAVQWPESLPPKPGSEL